MFPDGEMREDEIAKTLQEYTVFTFLRNPYTRSASAHYFQNTVWRSEKVPEDYYKLPHCNLEWGDYCKNPRALGLHCSSFPECCQNISWYNYLRHSDP